MRAASCVTTTWPERSRCCFGRLPKVCQHEWSPASPDPGKKQCFGSAPTRAGKKAQGLPLRTLQERDGAKFQSIWTSTAARRLRTDCGAVLIATGCRVTQVAGVRSARCSCRLVRDRDPDNLPPDGRVQA